MSTQKEIDLSIKILNDQKTHINQQILELENKRVKLETLDDKITKAFKMTFITKDLEKDKTLQQDFVKKYLHLTLENYREESKKNHISLLDYLCSLDGIDITHREIILEDLISLGIFDPRTITSLFHYTSNVYFIYKQHSKDVPSWFQKIYPD